MNIRQGDQYHIPIRISLNGEEVRKPGIITASGVDYGFALVFDPGDADISSMRLFGFETNDIAAVKAQRISNNTEITSINFEPRRSTGEELCEDSWLSDYLDGVAEYGADDVKVVVLVIEPDLPNDVSGIELRVRNGGSVDDTIMPDYVGVKVGDFLATWPKASVCECDHDDTNHHHHRHPHPDIPELLFDKESGRWLFPLKQYMSLHMGSITNVQVQVGIGDNYITSEIQTVDVERSVIQPKPLPCHDDNGHHRVMLPGGVA